MEYSVTVARAPAKINLFLEVLDLRPDGYHEVCLVSQSIDLTDHIWAEPLPRPGDDRLRVEGPFSSAVPTDLRNSTVLRAVDLMRQHWSGIPALDIRLEKNIPVGAGLGGGSADAAALAMKVREMFLPEVNRETVVGVLAGIGSDIPFATLGGTALVGGSGEKVTPVAFRFDSVRYVLVSPPIEVSTAWAYQALDKVMDRPRREPGQLYRCLREGDYEGFAGSVWNAFEAVVFAEYPELAGMIGTMEKAGCDAAWMTGSGSNLVGLCGDEKQAKAVMRSLEVDLDCSVRIVQPYRVDSSAVRENP